MLSFELGNASIDSRLESGLTFSIGPFVVRLTSSDPLYASRLAAVYPRYPVRSNDEFAHAALRVQWERPGIFKRARGTIRVDQGVLFTEYPEGQALPYVEWGINWCVATHCHFLLMLHAATIEKRGHAVLMPGMPGAGKSTLAAYLSHCGWRLLSDEFGLLRPYTKDFIPFPRLIPLKNEAIDIAAEAAPGMRIGPRYPGTRKGTVAHVTPLDEHAQCLDTARAALIVEPRYVAGESLSLEPVSREECFLSLTQNAFNYQIFGREGFETLAELASSTPAFRLRYSKLAEARECLDALLERHIDPQRDIPACDREARR